MKNLETPAVKLAIYGAGSALGNAVLVQALARQFEVTLVVDDLNAIDARPGLATILGDLHDPISVSQSIAGRDAVVCVLPADGDTAFHRTFKAVTALLDGLPVAGVKRLLLVGDFSWLDRLDDGVTDPIKQLNERLTSSPVVWTLFDAPPGADQGQAFDPQDPARQQQGLLLDSFASALLDEVCHAENMHQRIRVRSQENVALTASEVDVLP